MIEKWRTIKGYIGYEISNKGRVRSFYNGSYGFRKKPKIIKGFINKYSYVKITLRKDNKPISTTAHRLVAINFIKNPKEKPFVNHRDGNKINNKVSNLEWVTQLENSRHAIRSGLHNIKGQNHGRAKLKNKDILTIRKRLENKEIQRLIAKDFGVTKTTISHIKLRKTWGHV